MWVSIRGVGYRKFNLGIASKSKASLYSKVVLFSSSGRSGNPALTSFKEQGAGYQTRINAILKAYEGRMSKIRSVTELMLTLPSAPQTRQRLHPLEGFVMSRHEQLDIVVEAHRH